MGANTPILEYLLSIYANSFDYSFLKCKVKIKIQRYIKEHQEPIVVSNFYGYQTQSKNYVFRRHFPYYFQNWEFAYSLSMLIFVPKGLIKMKKNDGLPRLILDWCNILVLRRLPQIISNFATGTIWEFTTIKIKSLQEILCKNSVYIYNYCYNYVRKNTRPYKSFQKSSSMFLSLSRYYK